MTMVVYDTDGNVLANCAETTFRVSSKALALASPVFLTMFKPGLKEWLGLSEQGNTVIELPGDSELFKVFCDMAYHKLESLPQSPDPDFLQRLGIPLIDKSGADLWKLLQFAYALDLHERIPIIKKELICIRPTGFRNWNFALDNMRSIPEAVLDMLDTNQRQFFCNVEDVITNVLKRRKDNRTYSRSGLKNIVSQYVQGLLGLGILPGTAEYRNKSFREIRGAAKKLRLSVSDKATDLGDGLDDCVGNEEGVCLSCRKQGDCSKHPG
ncbi:hypothetical protein BDW62DRAFT_203000 [Aspergillus aurantiobrunneus]